MEFWLLPRTNILSVKSNKAADSHSNILLQTLVLQLLHFTLIVQFWNQCKSNFRSNIKIRPYNLKIIKNKVRVWSSAGLFRFGCAGFLAYSSDSFREGSLDPLNQVSSSPPPPPFHWGNYATCQSFRLSWYPGGPVFEGISILSLENLVYHDPHLTVGQILSNFTNGTKYRQFLSNEINIRLYNQYSGYIRWM